MQEQFALVFPVVGVVGADGVAEVLGGEVGVDFGGDDAAVAEHFLHGTEVGTVLHEFGGEGVAEAVGGNVFGDVGTGGGFFDELVDGDA